MERQKVTIDADRLTRVSLLKRAVLKRCVYGVDLNAMAVELAKVSLWLDAFTLGAPLSFLDHHLKHGNRLIGARITGVQDYLRGGGGPEQIDMFSGSEFAGVMLTTDFMRQVSYLSDNTIEQTRQSAQAYRDASDHLAPYKRLLDVYTSRWFSNSRYATKKADSVRLFLKDSQTKTWLKAPQTALDNTLFPATDIAQNALEAAEEKRFFHWELEFPEVFFAPGKPGGRDVQLSPNSGFDAVVGNPPYSDIKGLEEIFTHYLFNHYEFMELRINIFAAFIERSLRSSLSPIGLLGFIIPTAFLTQVSYSSLRKQILQYYSLREIIRLPNEIFGDSAGEVKVDTCLVVVDKSQDGSNLAISVLIYEGFVRNEIIGPDTAIQAFAVEQNNWMGQEETAFTLVPPKESALLRKFEEVSSPLEEHCEFCLGMTPYDKYRGHTSEQIKNKVFHANARLNDTYKKLLVSGDVGRYTVTWNGEEWVRYGNWLAAPREQRFFTEGRILIQQIIDWSSLRILAGWTDEEIYNTQNQFNLLAHDSTNLKYILAILNSTSIAYYHRRTFLDVSLQRFQKVLIKDAKRFPIHRISFTTPTDDREQLTREALGSYEIGDNAGILQRVQTHVAADKTDVVHDLLAHLAQRMIDLNKEKQGGVTHFLAWLEKRLKVRPDKHGAMGIDSLAGRTILQGYLGDYQKGADELPWREFHYRLYQNRNHFAVSLSDVEGEIQREYENSLATLIPIKRDLARTDALIDMIVYRLYGLTDEEIELIERPQYEQALTDAKAQVVANEAITDDEEKIEKIAEGILPAARRFFERVEPTAVEELLDSELPNWRSLPPDAPTFLLTGDYNLRTLPNHMDFSASVIPYTKAVEGVLSQRIFIPFRQLYTDADCTNDFLKKFMRGEKDLTLGSFMIILSSSRETALRNFISRMYADAATRMFGAHGLVNVLNDEEMRDIRNKAAHDEVLSREEAQQTRSWAMQILGHV